MTEASDPRVASIVRELRKLSPEMQVEVAAELRRMLMPVSLTAKLEGAVQVHQDLLQHFGGFPAHLDRQVVLRSLTELVALVGGSKVSVTIDSVTKTVHFAPLLSFTLEPPEPIRAAMCATCGGSGILPGVVNERCAACSGAAPIPAGTPIVMELGRGFRPARPGEAPDTVARHVHPSCCQACGAFLGGPHAPGCPLSTTSWQPRP